MAELKDADETKGLKKSLSLSMLIFYGVGTIFGLGIYVLLGKVAGEAGMMAPFSFLFAASIAAFTGVSYGELSARIPKSAGEVNYVDEAFGKKYLSMLVGWLIILSAIVSTATVVNGGTFFSALLFKLETLAKATNYILIVVFILINLSLWVIKRRGEQPEGVRIFPIAIPIIGFFLSLGVLIFQVYDSLA